MSIQGFVGGVYMNTGSSQAMTTEATTANADYTIYTIDSATKRYIDKDSALTVYVDAGAVGSDTYRIELGAIKFIEAQDPEAVVTVSGKYFAVAEVGGFFNFKLSMERQMADATVFGDEWKVMIPTTASWTCSAEKFWLTEDISELLGAELILVFYLDVDNDYRYEGYGHLAKDDINCAQGELIKENIEFSGNTELFYRED